MDEVIYRWRKKHPKCYFCRYLEHIDPYFLHFVSAPDYYNCKAKDKIIYFPKMFRPWCSCYSVYKEENKNA